MVDDPAELLLLLDPAREDRIVPAAPEEVHAGDDPLIVMDDPRATPHLSLLLERPVAIAGLVHEADGRVLDVHELRGVVPGAAVVLDRLAPRRAGRGAPPISPRVPER